MMQFAGVLGWLNVILPKWFYPAYSVLLLVGTIFGKLPLPLRQRLLMLSGVTVAFLAVSLNLYVTWTPVGAPIIEGIQGRYLILLAMMIFIHFSCADSLRRENTLAVIAVMTSGIVMVYSVWKYFFTC